MPVTSWSGFKDDDSAMLFIDPVSFYILPNSFLLRFIMYYSASEMKLRQLHASLDTLFGLWRIFQLRATVCVCVRGIDFLGIQ